MIDILVYLFENYFQADLYPEHDQLARKLSAAGFDEEEITEALEWLRGLESQGGLGSLGSQASTRLFSEEEVACLGLECRSFLLFLEHSGVLEPRTRELIIDRALALDDEPVPLSKLKVIVLMVLWNQHRPVDGLLLDELLSEEEDRHLH